MGTGEGGASSSAAGTSMAIRVPVNVVGPDVDGAGAGFDLALWEFHNTIDELLDYLHEVGPFVEKLDTLPPWDRTVEELVKTWPQKRAAAFRVFMNFAHSAVTEARERLQDGLSPDGRRPDAGDPESVPNGQDRDGPEPPGGPSEDSRAGRVRLPFDPTDPAVMQAIASVLMDAASPPRTGKMPILLRSLITALVDAEEHLVGALVRAFYRIHPDAMGTDQPEFSVDHLRSLGSVDDAIQVAAERRVDGLLRAGHAEWEKWFTRNARVDFQQVSIDWPETREVTLRRHVIVHNGGRVSAQYVAAVLPIEAPPVGAALAVDPDYVRRAIDLVDVFGTLLVAAVWSHVCRDDRHTVCTRLHRRAYAAMKRGRWEVVKALCALGERFSSDGADTLTYKLNSLLARKRLGDNQAVESEAAAMDASALPLRFELVRLVLAGRLDEAEASIPRALAAEEISLHDLQDWPVLQALRERPMLPSLLRAEARKSLQKARRAVARVDEGADQGAVASPSPVHSGQAGRRKAPRRPSPANGGTTAATRRRSQSLGDSKGDAD